MPSRSGELGKRDPGPEEAGKVTKLANIPMVLNSMEEVIGKVDGVMISDDVTMAHQRRARPFLEAGIPTFIDKSLSPDPSEAAEIIALAQSRGTPLMSCSALRYAKELMEAQDRIAGLGGSSAAPAPVRKNRSSTASIRWNWCTR